MAIFTFIAFTLRRTLESIETPCSVKEKGVASLDLCPWPQPKPATRIKGTKYKLHMYSQPDLMDTVV